MKTIFVIAFIFGFCQSSFLRELTDGAITLNVDKVVSEVCLNMAANAEIKLSVKEKQTITKIENKPVGVQVISSDSTKTDTITTTCSIETDASITCKLGAAAKHEISYDIKLAQDQVVQEASTPGQDRRLLTETTPTPTPSITVKAFELKKALTHTTKTNIGVAGTQTDAAKKIDYSGDDELKFSVTFAADVSASVPKIKANSKELTCEVDSEKKAQVNCSFKEEDLPVADGEKETAYPVSYVNACGTESPTGVTVTVSSAGYTALKVGMFMLSLLLL